MGLNLLSLDLFVIFFVTENGKSAHQVSFHLTEEWCGSASETPHPASKKDHMLYV
jgi:hypothetical protein